MGKPREQYVRWDINDYAFVQFAAKKAFSQQEIAQAMGRSKGSIAGAVKEIARWKSGLHDMAPHKQKMFDKAMQLEFRVRSDVKLDQHTFWMKKLCATRNIEYRLASQPVATEKENEKPTEEPPKEKPLVLTVQKEKPIHKDKVQLPPLVEFKINTESILAIIDSWKGR